MSTTDSGDGCGDQHHRPAVPDDFEHRLPPVRQTHASCSTRKTRPLKTDVSFEESRRRPAPLRGGHDDDRRRLASTIRQIRRQRRLERQRLRRCWMDRRSAARRGGTVDRAGQPLRGGRAAVADAAVERVADDGMAGLGSDARESDACGPCRSRHARATRRRAARRRRRASRRSAARRARLDIFWRCSGIAADRAVDRRPAGDRAPDERQVLLLDLRDRETAAPARDARVVSWR